jgi:broad specificity phosphatase PhoE
MNTRILIIRHGETAWNRGQIFRGIYDIPLNENGKQQAALAAQSLKNVKIHAAYTSPLSRAKESAEIITKSFGISPVIHNGFIDMDYGEWTGKENSEVAKLWPDEHAAWIKNPHTVKPPGGTTLKEIFNNSFTAMEELAKKHSGETIAIFSHRVVNKVLIIGALSLGLERFPFIIQGNCCINQIERISSGYLIHSINDVSHIKNAGIDLLQADF